jgi:hypothetical protein
MQAMNRHPAQTKISTIDPEASTTIRGLALMRLAPPARRLGLRFLIVATEGNSHETS